MSKFGKSTASNVKTRLFYGWYIVASSWIMLFLTNAVAIGIFFKPILVEFGWDRATLSLAQSIALISYMIAAPLLGRIIDRLGPRLMILICVGTQFFSRLLNGVASNIWHIYLGRFFYEVKVTPATQVLANNWFVKKRGLTQGILASGMPVGTLLLTPLSQYLILTWGWRQTMLFWAIVTTVIMLPLAIFIRDNPEDKGYLPDGELPNKTAKESREAGARAKPAVKTGISLVSSMKTSSFWYLSIAHFICGIGCGFLTTHVVIFATDYGYSDMVAASLVSVQGGLNIVGVLVAGHLADRIAGNKVLALTHFVRTLSFATVTIFILIGGGSLWLLYLAMIFFGLGWFTTSPLMAGLVADLFGRVSMGTIISIATSAHTLGWSIGSYAGGAVFDATHSYYIAFLVTTLLSLIATGFALVARQKQYVPTRAGTA